jgi:hypothetical protein
MKCTICGINLDMRKKSQYVYASYQIQSKGLLGNIFKKDYWIFCNSTCKRKADTDWLSGDFERKHAKKKINFKP